MNNEAFKVGVKIRLLRERSKLSLDEFALLISVESSEVQRWEEGKELISCEALLRITRILETNFDFFDPFC